MRGTPWGRHNADESSFSCTPVFRSSSSALAQGWYGMLSTCRFAAKFAGFPPYILSGFQIPVRSGWPLGNRGRAAERSGLPSDVCGMLTGGTFVHCALSGADTKTRTAIERTIIVFNRVSQSCVLGRIISPARKVISFSLRQPIAKSINLKPLSTMPVSQKNEILNLLTILHLMMRISAFFETSVSECLKAVLMVGPFVAYFFGTVVR